MKELPKLYRLVNLTFPSLRNGVGENLGVIFDIDTIVERQVRRVLCKNGWKWQIQNINELAEYDPYVDTDQVSLDEIGMDIEDVNWT